MKCCPISGCETQIGNTFLMCKPHWCRVAVTLRRAFRASIKAFGPRGTWMKQIRENKESWDEKSREYNRAVEACKAAAASVSREEIERMMP